MTATVHPREHGVTLRCNWPGCDTKHTTALVGINVKPRMGRVEEWGGLDARHP